MNQQKVAIQGVQASFHHEAARNYFGQQVPVVECSTFRALCEALKSGEATMALMAIENTIAGSILPNYALLKEYHLKICGEVYLPIRMNLMALPGVELEDIEQVLSHPMAILQCSDFLNELKVKAVEHEDTAGAAKKLMEEQMPNTAVIAGMAAAERYQLNVLAKSIETNKQNYTRFLVLNVNSKFPGLANGKETCNKASLCFELGHSVGALAEVLNIFEAFHINLTKIQSVPIVGKPYEYSFHVDIEWGDYRDYEQAIKQVLNSVSTLAVLGEYPKGVLEITG